MALTVRYGSTVKVTNPADRDENSTFSISYEVTVPFADPPENDADYNAWLEARAQVLAEHTQDLRLLADAEIQKDVDTFIQDNTPGGN